MQQPRSVEAEFEVCTLSNNLFLQLYSLYLLCLYIQVCVDLGLSDHVWQDKHTAIALTVDSMGDQFRPAMRAGWLSYIRNAYPDGVATAGPAVGQGTLIVEDNA